MSDPSIIIGERYKPENRYANFGASLNRIQLDGFRGITEEISFDYPITAITGMNGSGKSTIGQLALCGYRVPTTSSGKRFYARDFFPSSAADPAPFSNNASAVFHYQTDKSGEDQAVTVRRANTEWSGYKRQPEKKCYYVGFTLYIPKVERRDMSMYSSMKIELGEIKEFLQGASHVSRIFDCIYDDLYFQEISHNKKIGELGVIERYGYKYSENNMGFGEGRVVYLVHLMESAPMQSLFVIEEPETSLHENAQHELAKYFVDVCLRKGHQIVLTTHSSPISEGLPPAARKYVYRDRNGVKIFNGFSSNRIRSALSNGHQGKVIVNVEDNFAASLLMELLRRKEPSLLSAISVVEVGDKKAVANAQKLFAKALIKSLSVRDADVGSNEKEHLYSFPGSMPPEKEVFACHQVTDNVKSEFLVDFAKIIHLTPSINHHEFVKEVAKECKIDAAHIKYCVIKWFLDAKGPDWGSDLVAKIKKVV
ncbi:MAG: AAA family ATPase [Oxalobacteraceae bacterium]|nr:MAG: AAA family ATPase [Oxalobacteraceae bacterium]